MRENYVEAFRKGDIFVTLKLLQELQNSKLDEAGLVDEIGHVIQLYSSELFISVEYAESLLSSVGKLVESETNCRLFSTTQSFITGIVDIIRNFHSVFFRKLPLNTSYWSHFCYELALYILLGLVEKSELMKSFLTVIDDNSLKLLVDTLILILPMDVLYLSQVRKTYCLCHEFPQWIDSYFRNWLLRFYQE